MSSVFIKHNWGLWAGASINTEFKGGGAPIMCSENRRMRENRREWGREDDVQGFYPRKFCLSRISGKLIKSCIYKLTILWIIPKRLLVRQDQRVLPEVLGRSKAEDRRWWWNGCLWNGQVSLPGEGENEWQADCRIHVLKNYLPQFQMPFHFNQHSVFGEIKWSGKVEYRREKMHYYSVVSSKSNRKWVCDWCINMYWKEPPHSQS